MGASEINETGESMEVGIDIGPVTGARTGVGNYCYYLVKHLLALDGDLVLKGFSTGLGRPVAMPFGVPLFHRHIGLPTRVAYKIWGTFGRPYVDRLLGGVDVYHATNYFLPPTVAAKRVVTIHDLTFLAAPHLCSPKIVGPFSRSIGEFAREADAILTYSESTTRDIETHLGVSRDKITVAPLAVDEEVGRLDKEAAAEQVRRDYGIEGPFVLFVGTVEPRKNIPTLLRAFAKISGDVPHRLVLAGATGWNPEAFHRTLEETGLGDRVLQTGYVKNHRDLAAFYSASELFAFPSYYEGFGLPVLEAMTCGCPVVAADNSSIPEVTGDATVLLPADDVSAWAETLKRLLGDSEERARLSAAGRTRAEVFSWRDCAERTVKVYRRVSGCA